MFNFHRRSMIASIAFALLVMLLWTGCSLFFSNQDAVPVLSTTTVQISVPKHAPSEDVPSSTTASYTDTTRLDDSQPLLDAIATETDATTPTQEEYSRSFAALSDPSLESLFEIEKTVLRDSTTDAEIQHYRQPWDQYIITATLNPEQATISGDMTIYMTNHTHAPLHDAYFHLYPNHPDFGGGSLWVADQVLVNGQRVTVATELQDVLLRVPLPAALEPEQTSMIQMEFRAITPQESSTNGYGAFNQEAGVWAMASFYPVLALLSDDGWDRRAIDSQGDLAVTETALYDVTLSSPQGWTLVTTGESVPTNEADPSTNDWQRQRFISGPQRDFFVAALYGFDQQSSVVNGTRIVSYHYPDHAEAGLKSLSIATNAWQAYETMYGTIPLAEFEIIEAPLSYFFGVEYPGVTLIDQALYWEQGQMFERTVAHEVSHQWWYNIVGNDAKGEPWLDEGLATYSQIVYYEFLGDTTRATQELQSFRDEYRAVLEAGLDSIVQQPTAAFAGNYFPLVYGKSALFFAALREQLGYETFFHVLQNYYSRYQYRIATGENLLAVAEETCSCDLHPLYADWITSAVAVDIP